MAEFEVLKKESKTQIAAVNHIEKKIKSIYLLWSFEKP